MNLKKLLVLSLVAAHSASAYLTPLQNVLNTPILTGATPYGVIYADSGGVLVSTAVGTAGYVLTSNGPGVAPTYQASAGGGVTSITGTSGQITVTGTTTPTLSIPSAMTGINSVTSVAGQPFVIATGTFGTSVTFASATGIPTFATHLTMEGVTSTGATGTQLLVFGTSPTLTTPILSGANANGILYANGSGVVISTAVGTAGQVLTSNGTGVAPTFQAASGGVSSITGTSGQITASASTGAVTLSIPTAMTGITSITAPTNTTLTLATLDNNKDIVFSPHGTGATTGTGKFYFGATSGAGFGNFNASVGTVNFVVRNSGEDYLAVGSFGLQWSHALFPRDDGGTSNTVGKAANRVAKIFVGPNGINLGDGTNGPTVTTGGAASPNESLIFTIPGTGECSISSIIANAGGNKRVTTQFDVTSSTTLVNVTGLSATLKASSSYRFRAVIFTTSNVAGGVQFAIAGTATATNVVYEAYTTSAATIAAQTRATSLGTAVGGVTTVTVATAVIEGTIAVNAAGTLTVQFAQNASNGSASSVLVGSYLEVVGF